MGGLGGAILQVTPERATQAKRLMGLATMESIRLVHVRAAHMTAPGCPVRTVQEKEMPTAAASLVDGTNRFRVLFGHAIHGRRGAEGATEVQVDATFELIYSFPKDTNPVPTIEELQAFADTNALMNCWPYWRELVQTTVARMNLPPLVVPLLRWVPQEQKNPQVAESQTEPPTAKTNP
jgi:hypothetical protein